MKPFLLYNSRIRQKDVFTPLTDCVRMYVCGPTVYDKAHIGNARPVVVFDLLFRILKQRYENVVYVRNITDVDDKIMKAARDKNIDIATLTKTTTADFHADTKALNALNPTIEPRATDHIQQMQDMITKLIDQDFAYVAQGHVLFNVDQYSAYGALSLKSKDDLLAGARVEVAPYKHAAGDFILWKPSDADQPGWDSPWGYGRPGWHIECSAMSYQYLGETFDIHGGGIDLIFPHHENENAQSCCAHQTDYMANFWVHNGHVTINGAKMSKSLNNFITVSDLRQTVHPEVIRLCLLSAHYRQPLDYTDTLAQKCKTDLDRFYKALEGYEDVLPSTICPMVEDALLDDLNTPLALAYLHQLVTTLNKQKDPTLAAQLKATANLFGILQIFPSDWFKTSLNQTIDEKEIDALIEERCVARQNKDFKRSDAIRDLLKEKGITLDDGPHGTTWRFANICSHS
ncbi:MAG: Cysteine--tRNA ligase [Holosporales bacterium]